MNAAISLNRKRVSVIFQVILALLTVLGFIFKPDFGSTTFAILAVYQPLSSIYYRVVIKSDLGGMRDGYDVAIGIIGLYYGISAVGQFIGTLIHDISELEEALAYIIPAVVGLLLLLPVLFRIKQTADSTLRISFIFLAVILGAIVIPASAMGYETGLMMMYFGLWIMLLAGPILAIVYIVIESIELNKAQSANTHHPLDL